MIHALMVSRAERLNNWTGPNELIGRVDQANVRLELNTPSTQDQNRYAARFFTSAD
jgi:hypothetical protein